MRFLILLHVFAIRPQNYDVSDSNSALALGMTYTSVLPVIGKNTAFSDVQWTENTIAT